MYLIADNGGGGEDYTVFSACVIMTTKRERTNGQQTQGVVRKWSLHGCWPATFYGQRASRRLASRSPTLIVADDATTHRSVTLTTPTTIQYSLNKPVLSVRTLRAHSSHRCLDNHELRSLAMSVTPNFYTAVPNQRFPFKCVLQSYPSTHARST